MMVSTRGRYALRMMIDLAENSHDHAYIAMKDIAERLEISKKYMEQIWSKTAWWRVCRGRAADTG